MSPRIICGVSSSRRRWGPTFSSSSTRSRQPVTYKVSLCNHLQYAAPPMLDDAPALAAHNSNSSCRGDCGGPCPVLRRPRTGSMQRRQRAQRRRCLRRAQRVPRPWCVWLKPVCSYSSTGIPLDCVVYLMSCLTVLRRCYLPRKLNIACPCDGKLCSPTSSSSLMSVMP